MASLSRRFQQSLFALMAAFLALSIMAPAAADSGFTVRGVKVDATASTAAKARDKALDEGQAEALQKLLRRMTLQADWTRLPKPGRRDLVALVRNLDIRNERSSSTRYLASLDVAFKAGAIRNLLTERGLGYSETQAQPVLVLPIYRKNTIQTLWDDPNPWRRDWARLIADGEGQGAVPLLIADGDLEDIQAVSADDAVMQNPDALAEIAANYGAEGVLVAIATESPDGSQVRVSYDYVGQAGLSPSAFIMKRSDEYGWPEAVLHVVGRLGDEWKRRTLSGADFRQTADLRVVYGSLQDWLGLQAALADLPIVRNMVPREITNRSAIVRLTFDGDFDLLNLSLRQAGMRIMDRGFGPTIERLNSGS